jgi:phosphoglycolate phosphatase/AHBA synthesis associated protein
MNTIAERLEYPAISREAFAQGWGQGVEADVERFYRNHTVPEIERCLEEDYPQQLDHLHFDPRGPAVVDALRSRRVPTALVTNTPGPLAKAILERGGLRLDAVVGGTDVPRPKPEPDVPLRACELLGVTTDAALLVGDTAFDRDAARAAGIAFAGLRFDCERRIETLDDVISLVGAP